MSMDRRSRLTLALTLTLTLTSQGSHAVSMDRRDVLLRSALASAFGCMY